MSKTQGVRRTFHGCRYKTYRNAFGFLTSNESSARQSPKAWPINERMTKILFICHGNICRSVMAEMVMKELIHRAGVSEQFEIDSAAVSREEIGNDIYPPMKRVLSNHGYYDVHHYAQRMSKSEFDEADYIFYMDYNNLYYLTHLFGESDKYHLITEYLDNLEIEDPWYTNRFEFVYQRIKKAVESIFKKIRVE